MFSKMSGWSPLVPIIFLQWPVTLCNPPDEAPKSYRKMLPKLDRCLLIQSGCWLQVSANFKKKTWNSMYNIIQNRLKLNHLHYPSLLFKSLFSLFFLVFHSRWLPSNPDHPPGALLDRRCFRGLQKPWPAVFCAQNFWILSYVYLNWNRSELRSCCYVWSLKTRFWAEHWYVLPFLVTCPFQGLYPETSTHP